MRDKNTRRALAMSFCAALFVISALYLLLTVTVHPSTPPSLLPGGIDEGYIPDKNDALTIIFFGTGNNGAEAGTYMLLRFDPLSERVYLAALLPETELSLENKKETLKDAYRYGGAQYTRAALEKYLGVQIDRYLTVNVESFILAVNMIGTIELEIEEEMTIADGDSEITLSPGVQLLDGRKIAGIARQGGVAEGQRAAMTGKLACAAIDQRIDIVKSTLSDKVFKSVINLVDTDISYMDYEQRKIPAIHLAEKERVAEEVALGGAWEGGVFRLHDTDIARLSRLFL